MQVLMGTDKPPVVQTIKAYGKQLFGFIRKRVRTDEDAEDILQDIWYQYTSIPEIQAIESVSGWLFAVARNKITDSFRKKKTTSLENFTYLNEDSELSFKELLLTDNNQSPEEKQLKKLFWDELFIALDELPANQKEVFVKNELEDLTLQEIADESGENLKTIISRKGYAVKFLRTRLESLYNELINK